MSDEIAVREKRTAAELSAVLKPEDLLSFDDALIDSLSGIDDILALAAGNGFEAIPAIGLPIYEKKDLIGKPFFILTWTARKSDKFGDAGFVSATIVSHDGTKKGVITDGSSGVARQLIEETERRLQWNAEHPDSPKAVNAFLEIRNGLRSSKFRYRVDGKGNPMYDPQTERVIIVKPGDEGYEKSAEGETFYI